MKGPACLATDVSKIAGVRSVKSDWSQAREAERHSRILGRKTSISYTVAEPRRTLLSSHCAEVSVGAARVSFSVHDYESRTLTGMTCSHFSLVST